MAYIPLEKLMKQTPSLFKVVLAAAERANEINEGSKPVIETTAKKVTSIALQEFAHGAFSVKDDKKKKKKPQS